jgi:5'-nucleotidase
VSLRILLTNDDGIDAPGLAILRDIAAALSDDVWVVAPADNQSGVGHRFSFGVELEAEERDQRVFAIVGGSPADCVAAGMTHLLGDRPADLVLSGVNNGQNLGDIVHCSGTAAGAREGAFQGAIGIALSQGVNFQEDREIDWSAARRYGADLVNSILEQASSPSWFNVNFPACPADQVRQVRVVPTQRFSRSPMRFYPSDNAGRFFIAIPETPQPLDPSHDFEVLLRERAITVSPMLLQGSDVASANRLDGKLVIPSLGLRSA